MKKLRCFYLLFIILSIAGCAISTPQDVMSPLSYPGTISLHSSKAAYLVWKTGTFNSEDDPAFIAYGAGLAGLAVAAIESNSRANHPEEYNYTFGKAHQSVFMISLRDILIQKKIFKKVELTTAPRIATKDNLVISINFKSTRAQGAMNQYKVFLDAVLIVSQKGKPDYKRNYFVESDTDIKDKSFKGQQMNASQQLLDKVLNGIEQAIKEEK